MRKSRYTPHIMALLVTLCGVGCAPKLATSDVAPPAEWLYNESLYPTDSLQISTQWWESFEDTTLNRLVTRALNNNRDIMSSMASVEAAQANIKVVRADYLPSLSLELEGEAEYTFQTKTVQKYTAEPTITWELSLFGALRQSNRQARAQAAASQWALRAMRLSVAAEVATTYFTLLESENYLNIAEQSYKLRAAEAQLIDSMFHYGMSSIVDREQARSLLYTALSDISQYRRAVEQSRLSLGLLLSENPNSDLGGEIPTNSPLEVTLGRIPVSIPIGLPSQLVERRPDTQQSYYTMEAAAAAVGIARAARYPSITLTGAGGVAGKSIKAITSGEPWVWSIVGELAQPIYNWGGLKNSERAARADYMSSLYNYEQSMLTAFAEVEQALVAIDSYSKEREAMVDLVLANSVISQSVGALYDSGMNDYLNVIDAERELYSSQMDLVGVITEQYISYVNLFKALGGGY